MRKRAMRDDFRSSQALRLGLGVGFLAFCLLGGCQKKLFTEKDPRTQFQVHDALRQKYVPMEEPDVFGEPQPALRARLTPPD